MERSSDEKFPLSKSNIYLIRAWVEGIEDGSTPKAHLSESQTTYVHNTIRGKGPSPPP